MCLWMHSLRYLQTILDTTETAFQNTNLILIPLCTSFSVLWDKRLKSFLCPGGPGPLHCLPTSLSSIIFPFLYLLQPHLHPFSSKTCHPPLFWTLLPLVSSSGAMFSTHLPPAICLINSPFVSHLKSHFLSGVTLEFGNHIGHFYYALWDDFLFVAFSMVYNYYLITSQLNCKLHKGRDYIYLFGIVLSTHTEYIELSVLKNDTPTPAFLTGCPRSTGLAPSLNSNFPEIL